MTRNQLTRLTAGAIIPYGGNRFTAVSEDLAEAFQAGDHLHVVQSTGALLRIPAAVRALVDTHVDAAVAAAVALRAAPDERIRGFYHGFADAIEDERVWAQVSAANAADISRAIALGRSTTRLGLSEPVRRDMIAGLRDWADRISSSSPRGKEIAQVDHGDWSVRVLAAPLGVIGFVFEGRPNVFADAAGVLATGNTAVLRIGGDALGTALAIDSLALRPALEKAGLPEGSISLIPTRDRSAGWALFSDARVALAVARGSGPAVAQLGSVARQSGIPLSAHGTGGAWLLADETADAQRLSLVVEHSLDRKVCNTVNVVAVPRSRAAQLIPVVSAAADRVAGERGCVARLHVTDSAREFVPPSEFVRAIDVHRAEGTIAEPRTTILSESDLGVEWEWEGTPELTVTVVDDLEHAIALFNRYSPQFVVSLVSEDSAAHARVRLEVNAPFIGDGFTRWADGQYALSQPELGLSNWESGRLLSRGGILTGSDLASHQTIATTPNPHQRR
ncbi:aldehyde dehydrogenase family protein [Microbacterium karelineae]|uniref:aldehyde dehydrogenase family protein n=1 Tax=Microbacterium karelineae TaxID=2654283 RepID=UPI0012EAADD0|nr:aldehyde dehydrogenase family protein [Microbacterium karelineae]